MSPSVLLALTDPEDLRRAATALSAAGFSTVTADGPLGPGPGREPPELVVLDGRQPEGGSFIDCLALRAGDWGEVPVAWLGGPEDEPSALAVGASVFLGWPLDEAELVAQARALTDPSGTKARLEAALRQFRARALREATQALVGIDEGPLRAWAQYLAGAARVEGGDPQAASEEWHALLDDRPDFWRAHVRLARLYHEAGFEGEAREHLDAARALQPGLGAELAEPRPLPELALPAEGSSSPPPSCVEGTAAADGAEGPPRPLVLLADDSELALAMIGSHLESAGYRVVTAGDGQEALARAREARPDLVVLDGLMPGLNGFEACAALKRDLYPEDPPPVLMLSAVYTKMRQRREAVDQYGADGLVPKTTDDAPLLEAARRLCPPPAV